MATNNAFDDSDTMAYTKPLCPDQIHPQRLPLDAIMQQILAASGMPTIPVAMDRLITRHQSVPQQESHNKMLAKVLDVMIRHSYSRLLHLCEDSELYPNTMDTQAWAEITEATYMVMLVLQGFFF